MVVLAHYRSADEDSGRWQRFGLRAGDIVISTRSKHGTTWMQRICALLVLQTVELPGTLHELSPWLDWLGEPEQEVFERLGAQAGRRIIKTHTPLDGVPQLAGVDYVVVARHPLDAAVSLYHQGDNLDRAAIARLTGAPAASPGPRPPLDEWLRSWIAADPAPADALDSLPGVMWHLRDAWKRRRKPNVTLVHYADLLADREREMRRLASRLRTPAPEDGPAWTALVDAASLSEMRAGAARFAPGHGDILKSDAAFFRRGDAGEGRAVAGAAVYGRYLQRAAELAPPDLVRWLHR